MRIIEPSYEILDRRALSIEEKIESFGRIAYKSEDKITSNSAKPFVQKMLNSKHFPVIEGSVLHLKIKCENTSQFLNFMSRTNTKYLAVSLSPTTHIYISGTIRALREALNKTEIIGKTGCAYLHKTYPDLFEDKKCTQLEYVYDLYPKEVMDELPNDYKKHIMCAVKFIHNRAFSHEIVRMRPCSFLQESQRYVNYSLGKHGSEVTFIAPSAFYKHMLNIEDQNEELNIWTESCRQAEKAYFKLLKTSSPQAARTVLPNSCKTEIIVYTTLIEWEHIFKLRCAPAAEPSMRQIMIPLEEEFWNRTECWE